MDFMELLKILAPVLGGFLAVGGIGSYYGYKSLKAKRSAEAQKINAEVVVTFADGWQKYAEKLEKRMEEMEGRYEKRIVDLERLIEDKDKAHAKVVIDKDKRIDELEARVNELENQLAHYQGKDAQIDTVRDTLHHSVDENMETLKK